MNAGPQAMSTTAPLNSHPKRKRSTSEQVVPGSTAPLESRTSRRRPREDALPETQNPFGDPNYPIKDFDKVYAKMRSPTNGISVADRFWRLLPYSKCFIGNEAVDWMTQNLDVDRSSAVSIGRRLMDAGIIQHVAHSEPFSDGHFFYRFQEDEDTYVLNMKRVWDGELQTRPAVQVSQELLTRLAYLCEEYRERFIVSKNGAPSDENGANSASGYAAAMINSDIQHTTSVATDSAEPGLQPSSQGLASGLLNSPMLGALHRNIRSSLPPYGSASTGVCQDKHVMSRRLISGNGDDIDFSLLAKSEEFRSYTLAAAELQCVQLVGLSHDELMAFFVNLYNILCLHGYVVRGSPNSFWRRWIFFRALSYRVARMDMTLDDIEHGILRGNKRAPSIMLMQQLRPSDPKCQYVFTSRDGRIHFVISAGTRSDPPVRILNGENLQEELHEATMDFLGCSVNVDMERKAVTLPRIFLWYADDFPTPESNLLRWVAKYLPVERSHQLIELLRDSNSKPTVSYESFDWNSSKAQFEAPEIRRKRRRLARECAPEDGSSHQPFLSYHAPNVGSSNLERMLSFPLLSSSPLIMPRSSSVPIDDGRQTVSAEFSAYQAGHLAAIHVPTPPAHEIGQLSNNGMSSVISPVEESSVSLKQG